MLVTTVMAVAAPAHSRWQWMKQSDGTPIEVMLVGDERMHYFVDREGNTFSVDSLGRLSPLLTQDFQRMERRAQARRKAFSTPLQSHTFLGERRQLVILAAFSNASFVSPSPVDLWGKIFNQEKFSEGRFHGSVHDYFADQSYGKFLLSFDLMFAQLTKPYGYYGGNDPNGNDEKVGEFVVDAIKEIEKDVTDWSPYDWDGDGTVEQVFILFAGKGQNDGGSSQAIWPQQWRLSEEGTGSYTVSSGGKDFIIDNFGCFAELDGDGGYGSFGTLCHEYGHCLGLPDFYYGTSSSVVHAWDVMDYGLYNDDGYCPAGYSAHERMFLGWLDIKELTAPVTIKQMAPVNEQQEAYLIRNDAYEDEFFVLENRQKTGWDTHLPGSGLMIFHIDYNEDVWLYGVPNSYALKRYSVVPANNKSNRYYEGGWAYPCSSPDNHSFTDNSSPAATLIHTAGGKYLGKPVTNIQLSDGLASFDFMGGNPSGIALSPSQEERPQRIYDLMGSYRGTSLVPLPAGIYLINGQKVVKGER